MMEGKKYGAVHVQTFFLTGVVQVWHWLIEGWKKYLHMHIHVRVALIYLLWLHCSYQLPAFEHLTLSYIPGIEMFI